MSLTKAVLRFAAPLPDLESFERFLFVGPHPDDIEIGAGATAAKLASLGKRVCFVICIDGRYGLANAPAGITPTDLIPIRMEEARKSASMLGVQDLRFLGFCDGGFYNQKDLILALAKVVGDFKPDVIFAPDPDVSSECHADHRNVGAAARQIACVAPYKDLMAGYGASPAPVKALAYYMTAKPNRTINTSGFLDRQLDAIFSCHRSQFPEGCAEAKAIRLYLKLRSADHGIRRFAKAAEGFRVLGQTHMHCLPEAGD